MNDSIMINLKLLEEHYDYNKDDISSDHYF